MISFGNVQSLHNLMSSEKQNLSKKYTDQEIKNNEVIEGIYHRHFQNFGLVRLIWYKAVQVSTRPLAEELIILTTAFIEKEKPTFTD